MTLLNLLRDRAMLYILATGLVASFLTGCEKAKTQYHHFDISPVQLEPAVADREISTERRDGQSDSCYNHREDYPKIIGTDPSTGLDLEAICFCSDNCPLPLWRIIVRYQNIDSKEECARIGGEYSIDSAWGAYIGCVPKRRW